METVKYEGRRCQIIDTESGEYVLRDLETKAILRVPIMSVEADIKNHTFELIVIGVVVLILTILIMGLINML